MNKYIRLFSYIVIIFGFPFFVYHANKEDLPGEHIDEYLTSLILALAFVGFIDSERTRKDSYKPVLCLFVRNFAYIDASRERREDYGYTHERYISIRNTGSGTAFDVKVEFQQDGSKKWSRAERLSQNIVGPGGDEVKVKFVESKNDNNFINKMKFKIISKDISGANYEFVYEGVNGQNMETRFIKSNVYES